MKKLLLSFFILFFSSIAYAAEDRYSIILIAGDDGTSLHLFKYHVVADKLPNMHEIYFENSTATLALFSNDQKSAPYAIKNLFDHVAVQLRELKLDHPIPILVVGTDQLHLLTKENSNGIFDTLQKYVTEHYKDILVITQSETISGKKKALYSWLAVNYLEKHFQNGLPPVGAIYINDISVDIAYAAPKSEKPIDEMNIKINGTNYLVFTKSFLNLGLQAIHENVNADEYAKFCYPKESVLSDDEDGDFNLVSCNEIYQDILKKAKIPEKISPTFRVPQFIAFGEVAKTYHFFGGHKDLDKESFEHEILEPQCHNVWNTLKDAYPAEPPHLLLNYCSNGIYFSNLFFNQLQLRAEQLKVLSKIHDENIHWAMGAALYAFIQ